MSLPSSPTAVYNRPNTSSYTCAYCSHVFVLRVVTNYARCPHCRKVSSAGYPYARNKGHICLVLGVLFLGGATGITVGTYEQAKEHGGIYVAWVGGFIAGVFLLIRACFCYMIKTSPLLQPNVNTQAHNVGST